MALQTKDNLERLRERDTLAREIIREYVDERGPIALTDIQCLERCPNCGGRRRVSFDDLRRAMWTLIEWGEMTHTPDLELVRVAERAADTEERTDG